MKAPDSISICHEGVQAGEILVVSKPVRGDYSYIREDIADMRMQAAISEYKFSAYDSNQWWVRSLLEASSGKMNPDVQRAARVTLNFITVALQQNPEWEKLLEDPMSEINKKLDRIIAFQGIGP